MIPQELSDKLLMLLEKAWVSSELSGKIKEELSKWKEIEVTKVEVKSEWEDKISPEMVDKMSPNEAKSAFKKHLEMCMKEEDDDDSSEWEDKRKMLLWKVNWWY